MKIIEPSFTIVTPDGPWSGVNMLRQIESYARVSHRSEMDQTPDSWRRFIQAVVVEKGDWSVTEHVVATVIARVDRGTTHEWVRHRIGSYTQQSTRFINHGKRTADGELKNELEFIMPEMTGDEPMVRERRWRWKDTMANAEQDYLSLLDRGATPQEARSVLPNATASTIVVTYNLRSWRQFLTMRTTKETHPDFKRVTIPLLAQFKERIPLLYQDIEPDVRQSIGLARAR